MEPPRVDQAMGRFGAPGAPPPGPPNPGAEARRAFSEAQSAGTGDPFQEAKAAWTSVVQATSDRLHAPGFQPSDPGESNLLKIVQYIEQDQGVDAVTATAIGLSILGQMAQGGGPQGPGGGAPPGAEMPMGPGGPPMPMGG